MSVVEDFFYNLIILENGKMKFIRSIDDIENLLEKLTKVRDTIRNQESEKSKKIKKNLDYLIQFMTNMASLAYIYERQVKNNKNLET